MKHDVLFFYSTRNLLFTVAKENGLWESGYLFDALALCHEVRELRGDPFAHAIGNHVGTRVAKNASAERVLPIVVVGHSSQGSLYASKHHWHVRV